MNDKEIWKEHPVYTCKVSNKGRVFGTQGFKEYKILKPISLRSNYQYVELRVRGQDKYATNGGHKRMSVHRLVLEAFVGPQPKDMDPDHINKKTDDNRLENLRWLDRKINRSGRVGKRAGNAKLKDGEVWLIKKILPLYPSLQYKTIAQMFKCFPQTIQQIASDKTYKRVKGD